MNITEAHRRAIESTRRFVAGTKPEQFGAPSPDEGWDVAALLGHIIYGNRWVAPLVAGRTIAEVGDSLEGDQLGADHVAAYDESGESASAAFEAPGALEAPCAVSYGPVPGSVYAGHRFVDVLIHGWDLAVATGQDPTLDPALVEECFAVIEPQLAELDASGQFGTRLDPPPGTDRQTQLLALLGRHP